MPRPQSTPPRRSVSTGIVLAVLCGSLFAHPGPQRNRDKEPEPLVGRYVRIELEGPARILSLAEVEVIRAGKNIALGRPATQSTSTNGGLAHRAVDGDRSGVYDAGSVTHTDEQPDPWWEVDLGRPGIVEQVSLWNRTDCCQERLDGLRVLLLDADRNVVWQERGGPRPAPRRDYSVGGAAIIDLGPSPAARSRRQEAVDNAIDRGVEYLIETQAVDGSWLHATNAYGPGATGFALYTLLKQGVPKDHQAIRRGFAYLRGSRPNKTYSVSCVLLALCALEDERDMPQIEALVEKLLEWQGANGSDGERRAMWAYPGSTADLSNTQFAALALRGAYHRGVKIHKDVWHGLIEATIDHQGEEVDVELPRDGEESRSGPPKAAGFRYRPTGGHSFESGSMTTAGLSILAIAREGLGGKVPGKYRRSFYRAERAGLNWLAANFLPNNNPGHLGSWHDYYLYGVERVGALFELERFGVHDWYWEGAGNFIRRQKGDGHWDNLPNTCFALLFLSRATSATTGGERSTKRDTWIAEGPDDEVRWRVLGNGDSITMFLSGFSQVALEEASFEDGPTKGLRITDVRYFVDGEEIAHIPADPDLGWRAEQRFSTQHRFERPGVAVVTVEVTLLDPYAIEGDSPTTTLHGRPLEVFARRGPAEWMEEAAWAFGANLLRETSFQATASSENNEQQVANMAVDGSIETRWICKPGEAAPELTISFQRPVRADLFLFYGLNRHDRELEAFDHVRRYEVWLDKQKDPLVVETSADPIQPGRLELKRAKAIRRIRIRLAERDEGLTHRGQAGLSEIAVLKKR